MVVDAVCTQYRWWGTGGVPEVQLAHPALQPVVESVPWGPCHQPVTCQAPIRSFDDDGRFVQQQRQNLRPLGAADLLLICERTKDQ